MVTIGGMQFPFTACGAIVWSVIVTKFITALV